MPAYSNAPPSLSISAQSGTGAGGFLDNVEARPHHSLFVIPAGTVTGGTVTLQLSNDGTNWFSTTTTVTASANVGYAALANSPAQFVRANITGAITGGGTVSVYIASA